MRHGTAHPLAGQTVTLNDLASDRMQNAVVSGAQFRVEDWADRVFGQSWMDANGNFAAMHYGMRAGFSGLPVDNEVLYGKIDGLGHIVHVSELDTTSAVV